MPLSWQYLVAERICCLAKGRQNLCTRNAAGCARVCANPKHGGFASEFQGQPEQQPQPSGCACRGETHGLTLGCGRLYSGNRTHLWPAIQEVRAIWSFVQCVLMRARPPCNTRSSSGEVRIRIEAQWRDQSKWNFAEHVNRNILLDTSPSFPGIFLSSKPSEPQGKQHLLLQKSDG